MRQVCRANRASSPARSQARGLRHPRRSMTESMNSSRGTPPTHGARSPETLCHLRLLCRFPARASGAPLAPPGSTMIGSARGRCAKPSSKRTSITTYGRAPRTLPSAAPGQPVSNLNERVFGKCHTPFVACRAMSSSRSSGEPRRADLGSPRCLPAAVAECG